MRNIFEYHDEGIYLEHHGILGQKWGIRRFQNRDGSLTAEGRKRYQVNANKVQPGIHKFIRDASFDTDPSDKVFKYLGADKKYLDEAHKVMDEYTAENRQLTQEVNTMFKRLRSSENIHIYEAASELVDHVDYFANGDIDNMTLEGLGQLTFHGVWGDGQQGDVNAYSMYASEKHLEDGVDKLVRRDSEISNKARTRTRELIETGLSEVGAEQLTASSKNSNYKLSSALAEHMMNAAERRDNWESRSGGWYANDADSASRFTPEIKKNIAKAKNYVLKFNNASDQNTWWYVSQAAENLGMTSTQLKNMTQSDWDRINQEISQLRKTRRPSEINIG